MKKVILSLFAVFCVSCAFAINDTAQIAIPKLVDLGATKCIPCKKMAPVLEELKNEYKGVFDVEFIDVWQKENSKKCPIYSYPGIPQQGRKRACQACRVHSQGRYSCSMEEPRLQL